MRDLQLKTVIDRASRLLDDVENESSDHKAEARALQNCLYHLMRDACDLNLPMTGRLLAAAIEAIESEMDQGVRHN